MFGSSNVPHPAKRGNSEADPNRKSAKPCGQGITRKGRGKALHPYKRPRGHAPLERADELGNWVRRQKHLRRKGTLRPDRELRLDLLEVMWDDMRL